MERVCTDAAAAGFLVLHELGEVRGLQQVFGHGPLVLGAQIGALHMDAQHRRAVGDLGGGHADGMYVLQQGFMAVGEQGGQETCSPY